MPCQDCRSRDNWICHLQQRQRLKLLLAVEVVWPPPAFSSSTLPQVSFTSFLINFIHRKNLIASETKRTNKKNTSWTPSRQQRVRTGGWEGALVCKRVSKMMLTTFHVCSDNDSDMQYKRVVTHSCKKVISKEWESGTICQDDHSKVGMSNNDRWWTLPVWRS